MIILVGKPCGIIFRERAPDCTPSYGEGSLISSSSSERLSYGDCFQDTFLYDILPWDSPSEESYPLVILLLGIPNMIDTLQMDYL